MACRKECRIFLCACVALAIAIGAAAAAQLPLKLYTTADGLASDRIHSILADSHGFLWLGTADGISRFDGYAFTNLTARDGLPGTDVHALVEGRDGTYWAATNTGLLHWDPAGTRPARRDLPEVIHIAPGPGDDARAVLEDRSAAGSYWIATHGGLYWAERTGARWRFRPIALDVETPVPAALDSLCQDRDGNLWIGGEAGLYRRTPSGAIARVQAQDGSPHEVRSLLCTRDGHVFAGSHAEGLFEIRESRTAGDASVRRLLTRENGLAGDYVVTLLEASDGEVWAGCFGGLTEMTADARLVRSYTTREGLSANGVWSLAEDRNGDLWIGSENAGVMRFASNGFRRYDARDGMASTAIDSLFENREGDLCTFTRGARPEQVVVDESFIECFDGRRFHSVRPRVRPGTSFGWGTSQIVFQDTYGEWWVPTIQGLYRFPAVPFSRLQQAAPRRIYTTRDGLPSNILYRLFEDRRGDIWIGLAAGARRLALWNRAADSFRTFSADDGIPVDEEPAAFAQDSTGAVWIGFKSGLARLRGSQSSFFRHADGVPEGGVEAVHMDRGGRLWIACDAGGVARVDHPEQERPTFIRYGRAQGLSSGNAFSLADDRWGRIYIGTSRALDRLDPGNGLVQHFTTDDGLAGGDVEDSFCDRRGSLWFGSAHGLSRLDPVAELPRRPPSIRIARVLADGVRQPLPELGSGEVRLPDLGPGSAPVQIDFLAVDFAPGGRPRYQYLLQGVDRDWSAASEQRSVVYGRLPAGRYRFRVRSIANDGSVSQTPAEVHFTILPPLWRRPEFLALIVAAFAAFAYLFHRNRLKSALAIERVRMRVATDLHDDVGAGLSEIAILSELARREQGAHQRTGTLSEIGDAARRLVDAMSDIVWSTDPNKDDVSSLAQRIRRFAANVLESQGIRWNLDVPREVEARRLDPETRRQILLIVKEALANVARHSGCRCASLRIAMASNALVVEVEDDGRGFSPSATDPGHGLANMRARALALRGSFEIDSRLEGGTRLRVQVPLHRRPGAAW